MFNDVFGINPLKAARLNGIWVDIEVVKNISTGAGININSNCTWYFIVGTANV